MDPVGAPQNEVSDRVVDPLLLLSLDSVFEDERACRGAEALGPCAPTERETGAAGAGVNRPLESGSAGSGNLGAAAPARIGQTPSLKGVESISVGICSAALVDHAFVPLEPECAQGAKDQIGRPRDLARAVEVFHADQPDASVGARVRIAGHGREERAEMEWTRRGRRETASISRVPGDAARTRVRAIAHRSHARGSGPVQSLIRAAVRGSRRVSCSRCRVWRSAAPRDGGCRSPLRTPRRSRIRDRRSDRAPRRSS